MTVIQTSPNQKTITIHKEICDRDHPYAAINLEAMEMAARDMHGRDAGGFMLWCYLAKSLKGTKLALSNEAVLECFGIKKDAYDNAVALLIKKGYLVETSGNHYDFYEIAKKVG